MEEGGSNASQGKPQADQQWPWWTKWVQKIACVLAGSSELLLQVPSVVVVEVLFHFLFSTRFRLTSLIKFF